MPAWHKDEGRPSSSAAVRRGGAAGPCCFGPHPGRAAKSARIAEQRIMSRAKTPRPQRSICLPSWTRCCPFSLLGALRVPFGFAQGRLWREERFWVAAEGRIGSLRLRGPPLKISSFIFRFLHNIRAPTSVFLNAMDRRPDRPFEGTIRASGCDRRPGRDLWAAKTQHLVLRLFETTNCTNYTNRIGMR